MISLQEHEMNRTSRLPSLSRMLSALAVFVTVFTLAACKNMLSVDRPTLITEEQVASDPALLNAIAQGAIEPFRTEYAWIAHAGAGQSDEALLTHGWSPWNQYDDRRVTPDGGAYDGISYPFLQQARVSSAKTVERLQGLLGDKATTSVAFARANAYAGYSALIVADHLCSVAVDGKIETPDQVRLSAIALFQAAVTAGTAATAADVVNLANVGIARAYLGMGNWAKTIEFASKVDPAFSASVGYVADADFGKWTVYNLYNRVSGLRSVGEFSLGYSKEMYGTLRDLRVPFETDSVRRLFDSRPERRFAHLPYEPESFTGWTPGGKNLMAQDAGIRFASGLEARYMVAEASLHGGAGTGSMTNGQVLALINERRQVGAGVADPYTGSTLIVELRNQRKLDFMLAGFRMPDLLRYERFDGIDLWPKGLMEGFLDGDAAYLYGTSKCWPIGASERLTP
jgi:hypothetical protein